MTADIDCVWAADAVLGEGPVWADSEHALYWVDIKAPALHRYVPATGATDTWPMPERIGCIAKRRDKPGFVAGGKTGFKFVDPAAGTVVNATQNRTLACDPIPPHLLAMIEDGGLLPHLKKRLESEAA